MISVIDYKAGNSQSVINALSKLGIEAKLVSASDELSRSDAVILPGVGSAGETMNSLRELGLIETLDDIVRKNGVPFLGICVGLQVLFDHSEEGDTECLHWLGGQVRRFGKDSGRVPQIGWNTLRLMRDHPLFAGIPTGEDGLHAYFVHSYHLKARRDDEVLAAFSGLGYYRRARLLHAGAKEVVARHGGEVPRDPADTDLTPERINVGDCRSRAVPSPSWRSPFRPQQNSASSSLTAQVWLPPAEISTTPERFGTVAGTCRAPVVPSPS